MTKAKRGKFVSSGGDDERKKRWAADTAPAGPTGFRTLGTEYLQICIRWGGRHLFCDRRQSVLGQWAATWSEVARKGSVSINTGRLTRPRRACGRRQLCYLSSGCLKGLENSRMITAAHWDFLTIDQQNGKVTA